jgi:methylation protein EvaC
MQFGLNKCRVCGIELNKIISFGKMPIANGFLKKEDLDKDEYFYDMEVGFCPSCYMVQLIDMPPYEKYIVPDETGKTNYAFFSSTSNFMEQHFADFAKEVELKFLGYGDKVLEIGSNDGIMLQAFKQNQVLGIEPSQNVADIAKNKGIETITEFFTKKLVDEILRERGKFKAILSANVALNIIEIHELMDGIFKLLDYKGVYVTEDPYLMDILEKKSYDQIYDEHVWYFSLHSLKALSEMHGMEVFDAEKQWVHGGSMRVYMCKKGEHKKTERYMKYFEEEKLKGIDRIEPFQEFARNVEANKEKLRTLLLGLKANNKKIVGYGASSKGTIVQNYCDIGKDIIEYISDTTEFKQGKYSPGKRIPIVKPEIFNADNADYAVLGAWNHAKEIMEKEKNFINRGGKFIVHLPEPRILGNEDVYEDKKQGERKYKDNGASLIDVKIKKLNIFANDQGYLFETLRNDDEFYDGKFGQCLISELYPEVIKGLHRHWKQTDYTTCIRGNIKYVVAKEKENGTADVKVYTIGESNPIMIKVPPGLWHGYMPLGNEKACVLHVLDKAFDINDPDTERIDHESFGDVWTVKPS